MTHDEKLDGFFAAVNAGLQLELSDESRDFARQRLLSRARKRARYRVTGLREKAILDFETTNEKVRSTVVSLDPQVESDAKHFITVVLERYTSWVDPSCVQMSFILSHILSCWRYGPGAANGVKGTHVAEKIGQKMTCNDASRPLVEKLRGSCSYFARFDCENSGGITFLRGSRLSTVPKNEDTERTIAIEPSGQMALQLAAGTYLEGVLRSIGLDITCQQPLNKAMAQRGSIDGGLATIDMKSASDMISVDLVRRLMPKPWFDFLMAVRSSEIETRPGHWVNLAMISTMGNGFTFPLMTLLIIALIYGFRAQTRGSPTLRINWTDTCVFGDDVIVPTKEYIGVCSVLESAGFVINHDKSFSTGFFRESCGGDYHRGYDVTPFYVKSLATAPDVYVAINQVLTWSRRTNILLHGALAFLISLLDGKPFLVPEWFGPSQGIRTVQVKTRFKYLKPVLASFAVREDDMFRMMLACGGFVESVGPHMFYTPRPTGRHRARYVVRESRLPRGYLDGWDPSLGSQQSAYFSSAWLANFIK